MLKRYLLLFAYPLTLLADPLNIACVQALKNDPSYLSAIATWELNYQDVPMAKTAFLPRLNLNLSQIYQHISLDDYESASINQRQWSLDLSQAIFDLGAIKELKQAKLNVKASRLNLINAAHNTLLNATKQYFAVIVNLEKLNTLKKQQQSLYRYYINENKKFKAGLANRYNASAAASAYKSARVATIKAKNTLANSIDKLTEITGKQYKYINTLGKAMPINPPIPNNRSIWHTVALTNNYLVKAAKLNLQAAQSGLEIVNAANWPTLVLSSSINKSEPPLYTPTSGLAKSDRYAKTIEMDLNFPIINGGKTIVEKQKALAKILASKAQLQQITQQTSRNIDTTFRTLLYDIELIKALNSAVKAAQIELQDSKVAYQAGTVAITDVLSSIANFYQTKQRYTEARYKYLTTMLQLKQLSALLKGEDIALVSSWFTNKKKLI